MAIKKQIGELTLHVVDSELVLDKDTKTISGSIKSYNETEEGIVLAKTSEFKIDEVDFEEPVHETIDAYVNENLETIVVEAEDAVFEQPAKKRKFF